MGCGTVFYGKVRGENVLAGVLTATGTFFLDYTHPPFAHFRDSPDFVEIVKCGKSRWPRCLLWLGWLPELGGW